MKASPTPGAIWTSLYDHSVIDVFYFLLSSFFTFLQEAGAVPTFCQQSRNLYGPANPNNISQVLERMDDTVPRAPEIMQLPIQSVNYGLDLLRDLYYAKREVPDVLRRFIGAYRQSNGSSVFLHSTSLVNLGGKKIYRIISQDELLKFSKAWFANLVMKATFSCLDSALMMWNSINSGSHCIIFSATSKPHENTYCL